MEFASRDAVENALTLNESSLLSRSIKVSSVHSLAKWLSLSCIAIV